MSSRSVTRQNSSDDVLGAVRSGGGGVDGVLDDADGDRWPVCCPCGVQHGQVGAVGQHLDRGEFERRRRPPEDVRAGREHVAGQAVGQEVPVAQRQHLLPERRDQVAGEGLLADGVGAVGGAEQRPGPGLGGDQPADLRIRAGPRGVGRAPEEAVVLRRCPARRWWCHPPRPAAGHSRTPPRRPAAPVGPATSSNSMCSGSAPNLVRARARFEMFGGRHRRPPPPSATQPSGSRSPSSSCRPRRR